MPEAPNRGRWLAIVPVIVCSSTGMRGGLCVIHREIGVRRAPSACRHFPRQVLHDARGTLISLSHFCPTAAAMLLNHADLSIVEAMPPLRLESVMEGLDASDALPPLMRPGLLSDISCVRGMGACRHCHLRSLALRIPRLSRPPVCGNRIRPAMESGTRIASRVGPFGLRRRHPVGVLVASLNPRQSSASRDSRLDWPGMISRRSRASKSAWARAIGGSNVEWFERGMKNYLAARLFGNWIAYQSQGLRSIVAWLRTCAAVVRHFLVRRVLGSGLPATRQDFIEAVRAADLLLLHVLDTESFARDVAALEAHA